MTIQTFEKLKAEISEIIELLRDNVMATTEVDYSDSRHWPHTRARLLKAFGDRGAKAHLSRTFSKYRSVLKD